MLLSCFLAFRNHGQNEFPHARRFHINPESRGADGDTFYQQLNDPGLLRRKQFIPHRLDRLQRQNHLLGVCCGIKRYDFTDGLRHHLGCLQHFSDLCNHRRFNLAGRSTRHRASLFPDLHRRRIHVVAIHLVAFMGGARRHGPAIVGEDQALQEGGCSGRTILASALFLIAATQHRLHLLPHRPVQDCFVLTNEMLALVRGDADEHSETPSRTVIVLRCPANSGQLASVPRTCG